MLHGKRLEESVLRRKKSGCEGRRGVLGGRRRFKVKIVVS